jgi:hypothetical protein
MLLELGKNRPLQRMILEKSSEFLRLQLGFLDKDPRMYLVSAFPSERGCHRPKWILPSVRPSSRM